ncbi:putative membrane protein [Variovorax boronicumulans]|uniref:Membrane protein n=1 Tax=Variovorax boronicumulans TaxID=436515 RepID=A0AAW8E985_9BURK|nr:bestrophin family ion channel [Variovorax boronicumulans]MDP9882495.1 putative membrane protein [Variovorax boronicumulans]MDP9927781.1 putative membrane protein [Variovorax boronicumulans]
MIIRPKQNWFRMLFVWNGSVLQSIIPQLLFMAIVSSLAVFTHGRVFGEKIPLNTAPFTLFGVALALFLGFRNNASYARFIEARHFWGNLLIAARTLTSQICCYLPDRLDETERVRLARSVIALAYALKHQLRRSDPMPDLHRLLGDAHAEALRGKLYKPVAILNEIRSALAAHHGRRPPDTTSWMFDAQINEMEKTVGGCERIASTPIPFAYSVLLHRTVYAYCILLPFGLVDSTVFFTPLICVFIAYTLIALEAIADQVAEPFGLAPNALALDAMTRTIERSIFEMCGQEVPPELAPVDLYRLT